MFSRRQQSEPIYIQSPLKLSRAFRDVETRRQSLIRRVRKIESAPGRRTASEAVRPLLDELDGVAYMASTLETENLADAKLKCEILLSYLEDQNDLPGQLARSLCHDLMRMQLAVPNHVREPQEPEV